MRLHRQGRRLIKTNDTYYSLYNTHTQKAPVGYCYKHRAAVTVKQMKRKQCLSKQCNAFKRYPEHPFWEQQAQRKEWRKQKKQA